MKKSSAARFFERDATQDNEFCVLSFKPGWPKVVARLETRLAISLESVKVPSLQ